MPTRSYLGPATLVIDLREEPVTVHLEDRRVADDRREWGGEVKTSDGLLWEALAGADLRLRIHGHEAPITMVGDVIRAGAAQVKGAGPAPF